MLLQKELRGSLLVSLNRFFNCFFFDSKAIKTNIKKSPLFFNHIISPLLLGFDSFLIKNHKAIGTTEVPPLLRTYECPPILQVLETKASLHLTKVCINPHY